MVAVFFVFKSLFDNVKDSFVVAGVFPSDIHAYLSITYRHSALYLISPLMYKANTFLPMAKFIKKANAYTMLYPILRYLNCFGFSFLLAFSAISTILFCLVSGLLARTTQLNRIFLADLLKRW